MTDKQTEALKLALEALEWINRVNAMEYEYQQKARESLNAIYEALAEQPAQKPVFSYTPDMDAVRRAEKEKADKFLQPAIKFTDKMSIDVPDQPLFQKQPAQQEPATLLEAFKEFGEGWESLAWELCADENGEEACSELIWEGGPIPEPWGDRWLKYEDEAKRLIALVHKHTSPPNVPSARVSKPLTDEQIEFIRVDQEFNEWAISEAAFRYAARAIEAAHNIKE